MNVDQEFFRIVEELGPLGSFEIPSSSSEQAPESGGCGCRTEKESACCSKPAENAWSKVTFAGSDGGPADKRITPFPKWDPQTRAWWVWDESKGSWLRAA
jgi:hypothetical protein